MSSLESDAATEGLAGKGADDRCSGLDRRVVELLESACEVLAGQGRLWNLLRPRRDETAVIGPAELLPAVVEAARELSEAGCAGLGWAVRGEPFRFLEDPPGIGVSRIGPPPEVVSSGARSVAGGRPIRSRHRRGIPVLCVPIPPRSEVSGYLYVADKCGGVDFTGDDEELLVALALAAADIGGPIRLDEAAIPPGISTEVPARAETGAVLRALAQTVMQLVDGDAAVVVQPIRSGSLRLVAAAGQRWTPLVDQLLSIDGTLSGLAINRRRAVAVPGTATERAVEPGRSPLAQPVAAAPMFSGDRLRGALTVSRPRQAEPFSQSDIGIIAELAAHSGLLLDLADANRLDGPGVPAEDPAHIAKAFKADLEQRLVLYAATMHALASRVRRGRVVRELLVQAEQLQMHVAETVGALGRTGFGAAPGTADAEDT